MAGPFGVDIEGITDSLGAGLRGIIGRGGGVFDDDGDSPFARFLASRGENPFARFGEGNANPFARLDPRLGGGLPIPSDFLATAQAGPMDVYAAKKQARQEARKPPPTDPNNRDAPLAGAGDGGGHPATGRWRKEIADVALEFGLDPDAIQALMMIENNAGDPNKDGVVITEGPYAGQRAIGLLQAMPDKFGPGEDLRDPRAQIRAGARYFADMLARFGGNYELAAAAYIGGPGGVVNGQPRADNPDAWGTTSKTYADMFRQHYARLKASARQTTSAGAAGDLATTWGGGDIPITQEFGRTPFSTGEGASIYDFGAQFGLDGDSHTGLDIGMAYGSAVYTPVSGTVIIAGGGAYSNVGGGTDPATSGEVRIRLDNGEELILGHLSAINVRVGQRIAARTLVGASGDRASPHLHIEWRVRDDSTPSRWRIINPLERLRHNRPLPPGHAPGDGHTNH